MMDTPQWRLHREMVARHKAGLTPIEADHGPPTLAVVRDEPPGPGTILHRWLDTRWARWLGFTPREGCGCDSDAAEMDRIGAAGVLADLGHWTDRLASKPQAAGVPRWLVSLTIWCACIESRRLAKNQETRP